MEKAEEPCGRSFKRLIEQELGRFPLFVIYAFLEWVLIVILFVDGSLALLANEFARFFDMRVPCLFCTRIDHVLVSRSRDFYHNHSLCDSHKMELSSMAYCHFHGKLSDVEGMCEGCLLSFVADKESHSGCMYKSLVGILLKDLERLVQDDSHVQIPLPSSIKKEDDKLFENKNSDRRCLCCHESFRTSSRSIVLARKALRKNTPITQAPTSTPRAPPTTICGEEMTNPALPRIRCRELRESDGTFDDASANPITPGTRGVDYYKATSVPLLTGADDIADALKTPPFIRGNRFFGLSDSPTISPRWGARTLRRSLLEKVDPASESADGNMTLDPADGNSIVSYLKRQVTLDRKSLVELYMELDEERSASAVAANNAMAMITRLQAEKAAVQMEALQYQRMMDEQAEYDQEVFREANNLLVKQEEELQAVQAELEAYRLKYGYLENEGDMPSSDKMFEDFQGTKTQTNSISNIGSEDKCTSPHSVGEDDEDDLISLASEIQFADLKYLETFTRTEAHL